MDNRFVRACYSSHHTCTCTCDWNQTHHSAYNSWNCKVILQHVITAEEQQWRRLVADGVVRDSSNLTNSCDYKMKKDFSISTVFYAWQINRPDITGQGIHVDVNAEDKIYWVHPWEDNWCNNQLEKTRDSDSKFWAGGVVRNVRIPFILLASGQ
jgi:hypothetical protein